MQVWEIHPILTHFTIAFLLAGVAVDLFGLWKPREILSRSAAALLVAGIVSGVLTAAAGFVAFFTVPAHTEQAHKLLYWHLGGAAVSLVLFTLAGIDRWKNRAVPSSAKPMVAMLVASLILIGTGFLGGTIVYHGGAGVEPNLLIPEIRHGHTHEHEHEPHTP
jgi:uncharacterized membrane protein